MKFANPGFLFGLFAVAIPIIIHLFNFRKFKKVYFSNVRFLKEVKQETQSKSKIKHLLVLLSRILAITALVFAFSEPYIPVVKQEASTNERVISVYLDNSFSMEAVGKNGTLLDEAKKNARDISASFNASDQFQLLTNDFEPRHQHLVNREEFLNFIDEVKVSPSFKTFSQVFSRQADILNPTQGKSFSFIVSDFQKNFLDIEKVKNDTSINARLITVLKGKTSNIFIDSCWFTTPFRQVNQPQNLVVRIKNSSDNLVENVPLKLYINNQQKGLTSFNIPPNGTVDTTISFTISQQGLNLAVLEIPDHPITYDDKFYFSFSVDARLPVLIINSEKENSNLNSLFKTDPLFELTNVNEKQIDYSTLSAFRLLVLNELSSIPSGMGQELRKYVENGGSLVVFPGKDSEITTYNDFFQSLGADTYGPLDTVDVNAFKINYEHPVYEDVFERKVENIDLPVAMAHYQIKKTSRSKERSLMRYSDGSSFLSEYLLNAGKVYISSVPLDPEFSNFSRHALFVPTMYKIALYSAPTLKYFYTIAKSELIQVNTNKQLKGEVFKLTNKSLNFEVIPEHQVLNGKVYLDVHDQVQNSGNYYLVADADTIQAVAFNYDRKESDLSGYSSEDLKGKIEADGLNNFLVVDGSKEITTQIKELSEGKRLWKLFLILALVFLAIETLLLKFWKK